MRLPLLAVCLGFCPIILSGQNTKVDLKAEEAAIRAVLTKGGELPYTEDRIVWSGAEKRPGIGTRGEPFPEAKLDKRKNSKNTGAVDRIEVAAAGDMAWVFSHGTLEYYLDETPVRHVAFERATLMVWKKVNGQWKVAALFTRPLDRPFMPAPSK
jgi:ketosteroid isomerase-like protein